MVRNKKASSIKIKFNRTGRTYIYKEEENAVKTLVAINCSKNISKGWPLKMTSEKLLWLLEKHLRRQAISLYVQSG
jgi:hypothetical protein